MLDPLLLRERYDALEAGLRARGLDPAAELSTLVALEAERRRLIPVVENLKREQNAAGEAVARAKRAGEDPSGIFAENKARAATIRQLETELSEVERKRDALMLTLPNLPHESVPVGSSAADNVEVRRWGTPREFAVAPKPHWELGAALGILDFERATRMSGAAGMLVPSASASRSAKACSDASRAARSGTRSSYVSSMRQ